MKKFEISKAASTMLANRVNRNGHTDPVISLVDSSVDSIDGIVMPGSSFQIDISVFERSEYPPDSIINLNGINICLPDLIRDALDGYMLDASHEQLMIVGKQNEFLSFNEFIEFECGNSNDSG